MICNLVLQCNCVKLDHWGNRPIADIPYKGANTVVKCMYLIGKLAYRSSQRRHEVRGRSPLYGRRDAG